MRCSVKELDYPELNNREEQMRLKKAIINSFASLILQIVTILCGFILPRLILNAFGSEYNGVTSSISQFMSCVVILRAGIGSVTRTALYKPLADQNIQEISKIVKATEIHMKKVALIFAVGLLAFASIYPLIIHNQFEWYFTFTLVLIIGSSTFVQNYFGLTYQFLIQADQKQYIYSCISIVTTILNTIIAMILIRMGCNIHEVKLGSAFIFAVNPLFLNVYVKKKYKIDLSVKPDNDAIKQRWDAFAQQIAAFITNNTDIMVLTIFCDIKEVSVYSIYHLVINGLYNLENTLCNGIDAAFGNMIAKGEIHALRENIRLFEYIVFSTSAFLFICGGNLIVPFVNVYTSGINDVSYSRNLFGIMICINQFLFCIRLPYQMLVEAAGHFKQTRNGAIFEAIINIGVSVTLVSRFGLIGVSIGTLAALLFRTVQYSYYASKYILHRDIFVVIKRMLVSILEAAVAASLVKTIRFKAIETYSSWIEYSVIAALITAGVILLVSLVVYKDEMKQLYSKFARRKKDNQ